MPKPVRLLLISPRYPESFWSFRWALDKILPGKRALNPPLGLATLAAICPAHWQVRIVDENIEAIPANPEADIVGICGMGVQFERQRTLLAQYRDKGYFTVAGGSFASLCPERYETLVDTVVAGEAEYIWPAFCADYEAGTHKALYRETGSVDLKDSPTPRFDLLDLSRYTSATLQFSRGCPYLCEFCDIIVMFGRRPRHKSVQQIGRELDALRAQGARSVFFVDDNLIGNRPVARDLLRFLRDYQRQHGVPMRFGTEVSLNLAQDEELLSLFREAGFGWLFVGIESSDPETLKATRKTQNVKADVLESVHHIQTYGLDVLGGFIVGFDADTPRTFEQQFRFIMKSGIQAAMVGLLTALPRTPLYERLKREKRLVEEGESHDNTRPLTNVIPKSMSMTQMVQAYERLYRRLLSDEGIAGRVRAKMRHFAPPRYGSEHSLREGLAMLWRLLRRGIFPGGWRRTRLFLRSLPWSRPSLMSAAVADWVCGLAMRDYVERHFGLSAARPAAMTTD